jgi:hypothetical protein
MDRWERSEDRILAENKAYFEQQAQLADERGDAEAAAAHRESADRTASFMGPSQDSPTSSDQSTASGGPDQFNDSALQSAEDGPSDAEMDRQLDENKAYFEHQAQLAEQRGDTEAAAAHRQSAERTDYFRRLSR